MCRDTQQYIQNVLRQGTIVWSGRRQALERARKPFPERISKSGKLIMKYHWQCRQCEQWFRDESAMQVDHIVEVGPFRGDWNDWIDRLFCGLENLQVLCTVCHMKKTSGYNATLKFKRRKSDELDL